MEFQRLRGLESLQRVRARYSLHHRLRPDRRGEGGRSHESGCRRLYSEDRLARLGATVSRELERVRLFREQARAQRKSEESARHLAEILDNISEGFLSLDLDWRFNHVNRAAEKIVRFTREEMLGRGFWELFPTLRGTRFETELRRAMAYQIGVHLEDYFPAYDIWLDLNTGYNQYGLAILLRDVTEQRRFNEQLRQTQKLESLGVLAGGVAHDFNNLLTGIMGNASLALEIIPWNDPARPMLRDVMEASDRASHLTRQLLAYAGKGRFIVETLNLSDLIQQISNLIGSSVPKHVGLDLNLCIAAAVC